MTCIISLSNIYPDTINPDFIPEQPIGGTRMIKRPFKNKLNDLDTKSWLKFQKSWFIHYPPSRQKQVLRHPAKFPESLAQEFIEFFTKKGQVILDPMAGTGSALIAALRCGRNSYGIELNPDYAGIAQQLINDEIKSLGNQALDLSAQLIQGDAQNAVQVLKATDAPLFDYLITSPPYWDMLHARGAKTQQSRRGDENLDVVYSDHPDDLGNIHDYTEFLDRLAVIYTSLQQVLKSGAYLTIIVKNIKKGGRIFPLAWDLASKLSGTYILKDEKIWCQDDIRLAPYGMGNAWVSNTFHHYCLQFRNP
jgi:DNA modification methylase